MDQQNNQPNLDLLSVQELQAMRDEIDQKLGQMPSRNMKLHIDNFHEMPQPPAPVVNAPEQVKIVKPLWLPQMIDQIVAKLTPDKKEETKEMREEDMMYRIDSYDPKKIYCGWAPAGSKEEDAVWKIKQVATDKKNQTVAQFADGDSNYDNKWSDREHLKYA